MTIVTSQYTFLIPKKDAKRYNLYDHKSWLCVRHHRHCQGSRLYRNNMSISQSFANSQSIKNSEILSKISRIHSHTQRLLNKTRRSYSCRCHLLFTLISVCKAKEVRLFKPQISLSYILKELMNNAMNVGKCMITQDPSLLSNSLLGYPEFKV